MTKRKWQVHGRIALVAAAGALLMLAQACGGSSAGVEAAPTAKPLPTVTPGSGTPVSRPPFGPEGGGPGPLGQAFQIGGPSEKFAAFLGIPLEQLQSELSAEGATPADVAESHGRAREELKSFFAEQVQENLSEAVVAGSMSQEDADNLIENLASRIDDIINGGRPVGGARGPELGLFLGGPSEELAAFLGVSQGQLESELSAEGATPGSVAETHGRTREELKTFFIGQARANVSEAVSAGTMSQEQADDQIDRLTSLIDSIIDREAPAVRPGRAPGQ